MAQSLIDIGFDVDKATVDQKQMLSIFDSVYQAGVKIDGLKFAPGADNSWGDLKAKQAALSEELTKLTQANLDYAKSVANATAANKQAATTTATATKDAKAAEAAKKSEAKINDELTNTYKQFSLAVRDAELRAKNLQLTLGKNHPVAVEATKDALAMKMQIVELDASTGTYNRNVGNYSGALTGYANTLRGLRGPTKLLGEALGIGAQEADQFRLVIEHSLQGMAAYFRAKEAGKENALAHAAAEHLETEALVQNTVATTAATTAQKALRIALIGTGIGAAIALVAGLVYVVYQYTQSIKEAVHQRELLNKLQEDAAESAGKELGALKESKAIIEDVNVSMKTRLIAVKNLKDEFPTYFDGLKTEDLLTGNVADAYDRAAAAIVRKAKAEAASSKIAELSGKQLAIDLKAAQDLKETTELTGKAKPNADLGGQSGAVETVAQVQSKIQALFVQRQVLRDNEKAELQKDLDFYIKYVQDGADETVKGDKTKNDSKDKSKQKLTDALNEEFNIYKIEQQRRIENLKKGVEDEGRTYDKRLLDLQEYNAQAINLIDAEEKEEKRLAAQKLADQVRDLEAARGKKGADVAGINAEIARLTQNANEALKLIDAKSLEERAKQYDDYGKRLEALNLEHAKKMEHDTVLSYGKTYEAVKKIAEEYQKHLDELRQKELDKEKALNAAKRDLQKQLFDEVGSLIETFVNNGYTKQKNAVQELIDKNNEFAKAETDRITNSTLSEQDKAAKLIQLQSATEARNKQFAKEQKDIDIKKAKFDKAVSIAKIIENTAVSITKAIAEGMPQLIPLYVAIGAVELAAAASVVIPSYKHGTENHPGGLARYGEAGPEAVTTPDGHSFVADKETVSWLPKGTRVKPLRADEINDAMGGSMMTMVSDRIALSEAIDNRNKQTQWEIARYLAEELKPKQQRRQQTTIINKIDPSWAAYLAQQVYGK
jgi:hypothetical protein